MNKQFIIKRTLEILRDKKLLKEDIDLVENEADSNSKTTQLQTCIEELSSIKNGLEQLQITALEDEESSLIKLLISKTDYTLSILNPMIPKETEEVALQEENSSVNMSVDKVIQKPDILKKLEDKKIDVNVVDEKGESLV